MKNKLTRSHYILRRMLVMNNKAVLGGVLFFTLISVPAQTPKQVNFVNQKKEDSNGSIVYLNYCMNEYNNVPVLEINRGNLNVDVSDDLLGNQVKLTDREYAEYQRAINEYYNENGSKLFSLENFYA